MSEDGRREDGVSDADQGGESQGQAWKGNNERPADPVDPVVTHNVTENDTAHDRDDGAEKDRSK